MAKEKRFIEDYNEPDEEDEIGLNEESGSIEESFESEKGDNEEEESGLEEETEESETPNIFEDNFGSFSSRTRTIAGANPFLESEPIQNLEKGLENVSTENKPEAQEETSQPMMYNAPQYGSSYDAAGYSALRSETTDITGGAATANLGREINMERWQKTALGYPGQGGSGAQGEHYIKTPEKQREARGLPFERGSQRRSIGWKEEY